MSSRSRRPSPPIRSDVATRSTGYEEEQERVRAWEAEHGATSWEPDAQGPDTGAVEEETPTLDAAGAEVGSGRAREAVVEAATPAIDPTATKVSGVAARRLSAAKAAIAQTKKAIKNGAGNQFSALKDTKFNSYFRMQAMRDPAAWELDPALEDLAARYPDALTAAKADLAGGGNCGEHAMYAFDWLRMHVADPVNRVDVSGLDHAFILIGDLKSDTDTDIAVADPWPTAATAVLWADHFAFTADRAQVNVRNSVSGDDEDVKAVLAAGLRLSAYGEEMIQSTLSDEQVEDELGKGTQGDHPWIWGQDNAFSGDDMPRYRTDAAML